MAVIKHPQHDLPPDFYGRISGASVEQCNDILVGEFFGAEVASDPTGTMAAVESGADTFAASGDVLVKGTLAATEAGADTFAASGDVIVTGSMSATETGSDVAEVSGSVVVAGVMDASEVGDDIAVILGPITAKQKRGGSTTRKRTTPPKHIISTVESDEDRARALAQIMADEPAASAISAPPPVSAPTFTPQPLPVIDLAPVIAAAQQAIENAAQGAALQVAALESARLVALQAEREETARQVAQAILAARLRDEDEATALIFIMATA